MSTQSGIGDATVRFKRRLTGPDGDFQLAVLPFVKLPTAPTGFGNGKVEGAGGMAVPHQHQCAERLDGDAGTATRRSCRLLMAEAGILARRGS